MFFRADANRVLNVENEYLSVTNLAGLRGVDDCANDFVSAVIGNDDLELRLRDDVVSEANHRDDYQKPARAVQDGLYLVPKVIE